MAEDVQFKIKSYVKSVDSVIKSDAQKSLGSVLSHVNSSHTAVFIYGDNNKFLGLVSPYKTLYSSNYPYTTKVSSLVFNPPAITENTRLYDVAKHMLATKMYVLPVQDKDGEIQSVIYVKDILHAIAKNRVLLEFVSENVKRHTPITIPITSSVRDVFYDLKEKGVSRLIVVDAEGDLAGIVTRGDLMRTLIKPTSKMRFPQEGTGAGFYSLAGEKKFRKEEPIRKYYTSLVDSLPDDTPKEKIVEHLINSTHNSIVLVNKRNKPTGFLSTRDLLQAIVLLRPEEDIPLIIKKPSNNVSDEELQNSIEYLTSFGRKLKKRIDIEKIEVTSQELKNTKSKTRVFKITIIVTPVTGKAFVAVTKQRNFLDGVQEATTLITKQQKRERTEKFKGK